MIVGIHHKIYSMQRILIHIKSRSFCWMCPSAPRVCSEPGGQRPVLSLSLDLIGIRYFLKEIFQCYHNIASGCPVVRNEFKHNPVLIFVHQEIVNGNLLLFFEINDKKTSSFYFKRSRISYISLDMNCHTSKPRKIGITKVYGCLFQLATSVTIHGGGHLGFCMYWPPEGDPNMLAISFENLWPIPTCMQDFKNLSLNARLLWIPTPLIHLLNAAINPFQYSLKGNR